MKKTSVFHHIVFESKYTRGSTNNSAVLLNDEERIIIAKAISKKVNKEKYKLLECCILPDHVHLLIADMGVDIARIVNDIKGYSSYSLNRTLKGTVAGRGRQLAL